MLKKNNAENPVKSRLILLIIFQINKKEELLEKFQVEELEKRYEMGWITVVLCPSPAGVTVTVS